MTEQEGKRNWCCSRARGSPENPCPPPRGAASSQRRVMAVAPTPGHGEHRWLWASPCPTGRVWQGPEWGLSTWPARRLSSPCLPPHHFPSLCLRLFICTQGMGIVPSFLSLLGGLNEKIHLNCLAKCLTHNKPLVFFKPVLLLLAPLK